MHDAWQKHATEPLLPQPAACQCLAIHATLRAMLDFDAALALVLDDVTPAAAERVPLVHAAGRVLAEPLIARHPLPPFDYSAMDGYAVASADLLPSGGALPVRGVSAAGSAPQRLEPGTAMRIFTGGPVPAGADAIVLQEDVENAGDQVRFHERPTPGSHVRRRGEDLAAGQEALAAGIRLNPFQVGLAAALDYAELVVTRQPNVALLCTGDELRAPGSSGPPGSIPESNGVALAALVQAAGGVPHLCVGTNDDAAATRRALDNALALAEVVVTCGGVSVGDRDIVKSSLEALGVTTVFHKVAIKPGKPLYFGKLGSQRILGLPGNPASAQVTFSLFGLPLLRALLGLRERLPQRTRARLTQPIRQKPGRRTFCRGVLDAGQVTPLDNQASGATTAMAWANAIIVISEHTSACEAGAEVEVIPFSELYK